MVEGEIEKAAIRLDQMLPVRNASLSFGAIWHRGLGSLGRGWYWESYDPVTRDAEVLSHPHWRGQIFPGGLGV